VIRLHELTGVLKVAVILAQGLGLVGKYFGQSLEEDRGKDVVLVSRRVNRATNLAGTSQSQDAMVVMSRPLEGIWRSSSLMDQKA
jgi:glutamate dehydrogenase/leucine dehydrogenase